MKLYSCGTCKSNFKAHNASYCISCGSGELNDLHKNVESIPDNILIIELARRYNCEIGKLNSFLEEEKNPFEMESMKDRMAKHKFLGLF